MATKCWKKFKKFWSKDNILPKRFAFGCTLAQGMLIVAIFLILLGLLFVILFIYYFVIYDYYTEDHWDYCVEEPVEGENVTDNPVPIPTVPRRLLKRDVDFFQEDDPFDDVQLRKFQPQTDREKAEYRNRKIPDGSPVAYSVTLVLLLGLLLDIFLLVALIMHWTEFVLWWLYVVMGRAVALTILAVVIIIRCRRNTRRLCWFLEPMAFLWLAAAGVFIYLIFATYSLYRYMKKRQELDNKMVKPRKMTKRQREKAKRQIEKKRKIDRVKMCGLYYKSRRPSSIRRLSDHGSRRSSRRSSKSEKEEKLSGEKAGSSTGSGDTVGDRRSRRDKAASDISRGDKRRGRSSSKTQQTRDGVPQGSSHQRGIQGSRTAPRDAFGRDTTQHAPGQPSGTSIPRDEYMRGTRQQTSRQPTIQRSRTGPGTSGQFPSKSVGSKDGGRTLGGSGGGHQGVGVDGGSSRSSRPQSGKSSGGSSGGAPQTRTGGPSSNRSAETVSPKT